MKKNEGNTGGRPHKSPFYVSNLAAGVPNLRFLLILTLILFIIPANAFAEGAETASELIKKLDDKFKDNREQAKIKLLALGQSATEELRNALKSGSPRVHQGAAEVLARMGKGEVLPIIIGFAQSDDAYKRRIAAASLGYLPSKKSAAELVRLASFQDASELNKIAGKSLRHMANNKPATNYVIEAVIDGLKNFDGSPSAILELTLVEIGKPAVPHLINALGDIFPLNMRAESILVRMGNHSEPALLEAIKNPDPRVRRIAAIALGDMKKLNTIPKLIKALKKNDNSPWTRSYIALALGMFGQPDPIPVLVKCLDSADPYVRQESCHALGQIEQKGDEVINGLLRVLKDDVLFVRTAAVHALGKLKAKRALPRIIALHEDKAIMVQQSVAWNLGEFGDTSAVPALMKLKNHRHYIVQLSACKSLCQLGNADGENLLILSLNHNFGFIRRLSAYYSVYIRDKRVIPPLIRLLDDPYPQIADIAELSLLKLTGVEGLGKDRRKWEEWWRENQATLVIRPEKDAHAFFEAIIIDKMGDEDNAIKKWKELIRKFPADPEPKRRLAEIYAQAKNERNYNPHLAIELAEDAAKSNNSAKFLKTLAIAYGSRGDHEKAIKYIREALKKKTTGKEEYEKLLKKFEKARDLETAK